MRKIFTLIAAATMALTAFAVAVPAVPANPIADDWYDCGDESGFSKFYFTLPQTDVDGNMLYPEYLSYILWVNDGYGDVYQFTFPAVDYTFDLYTDIDEVNYDLYSSAVDFHNYYVYMYRTNENDNPLFVRDEEHDGNIGIQVFYTVDGVRNASEIAWLYEVIVPEDPEMGGTIIIGEPVAATGQFYVNFTGMEDYPGATMTVYINGVEAEPIADNTYQAVEGENVVTVVVECNGYQDKEGSKTFTWTQPVKAPKPELNWDENTFTMEAVLPTKADYTQADIVLKKDGVQVSNSFTVEQTDVEQTIIFTAYTVGKDGDLDSEVAEKEVVVPAKTPMGGQTAAPEYTTTPGDEVWTVTGRVKEGDPAADVTIWLCEKDEDTNEWVPTTQVNNPYEIPRGDEAQYIDILIIAHIDGQTDGVTYAQIYVPAKEPPVSINEILNSQNVASVRYFNMAGQEMQEANGMTIMVVTYTDGTTSAIKVMK